MNSNTLEEMCSITTGKLDANQAVAGGEYPFYTCAKHPDTIDSFAFEDDVVLVAGNNAKGNFHVNRYSGKFNAYQRTYVLTAKDGTCIDYIYYALKLELKRLKEKSQGSQTKFLTMPILTSIGLKSVGYDEQETISKVLAKIDKKIELNNKINVELEGMVKLIYDYWFVQFDFPDANSKPYKSSGGKMVYNEALKREIPDGWEIEELSSNMNIYDSIRVPMSRKERESKQGVYPYYGATGILDHVDDYIFDDDYVLVAEDGSIMDDEGMPVVQFVWAKTWVNNHAHVLQAKDKSQNEFYFQLLKRIPVVLIKTGSIQMKINQANLMSYSTVIPGRKLIDKYSEFSNGVRAKLINSIEDTNKLSELRDWLLPMLMNGQVTVNDAPE